MTPAEEARFVSEAVRRTYLDADLAWPPKPSGPMPLDAMIGAYSLVHEEVSGLNHAAASALLGRWGVRWVDFPEDGPLLAGFIYANTKHGYVFVRRGDNLPRRRFTAAHELGHFRLHLAPELARHDSAGAEMVQSDESVSEKDEVELAEMERQANRFAAELLMPESVCRGLYESVSRRYGTTPRFLVQRLAGELLVSREAIAWRLYSLGLIEKPGWLSQGPESGEADPWAGAEAV